MARKPNKQIVLGEGCDIIDRTPCNLKVSISIAAKTAKQLNLPIYGKLHAIQEKGVVSTAEAQKTLRKWATAVNNDPHADQTQRNWATVVVEQL